MRELSLCCETSEGVNDSCLHLFSTLQCIYKQHKLYFLKNDNFRVTLNIVNFNDSLKMFTKSKKVLLIRKLDVLLRSKRRNITKQYTFYNSMKFRHFYNVKLAAHY